MAMQGGYKTCYPLAQSWDIDVSSTEQIGIKKPLAYGSFKHANCTGCIKGGKQHWYVTFCERPDIFEKAKEAERVIEHSILKSGYLKDFECLFERMRNVGIVPTEHIPHQTFWATVNRELKEPNLFQFEEFEKPCACSA